MAASVKRMLRLFDNHALLEIDDRSSRTAILEYKPAPTVPSKVEASSSVHVRMVPSAEAPGGEEAGGNTVAIEAVLGIYELLSGPFIAVVLESEARLHGLGSGGKASAARGWDFRLVTRVALLPLFRTGRRLSAQQQSDDDKYLSLLQNALAEHQLYFSHTHDVTHSFQRLSQLGTRDGGHLWQRADERFFWNKAVVRPLIAGGAHAWVTPVMSAFMTLRSGLAAAGLKFSLLFVSRRSCFRQGCRFARRGADGEGRCANFVETEQALLFDTGAVSSFVQVRGSIPCRWSSPVSLKYAPKVLVDGADPRNGDIFAKHVSSLHAEYESVLLVNLIDKKKDQGRLGLVFQTLAEAWIAKHKQSGGRWARGGGAPGSLDFIWFDFHKECAKMKWSNLSKLLERGGEALDSHGWFASDGAGRVGQLQRGVSRTNCMDNLDRTNVVQSAIARRAVLAMLTSHPTAVVPQQLPGGGGAGSVLELPSPHFDALEGALKGSWGDNADAISMLYSGTGALKTDFTRTGKRTFAGAFQDGMNSAMRCGRAGGGVPVLVVVLT